MTYNKKSENLIPPHGGYRKLKSYQNAEIVFDLTKIFCHKFLEPENRSNSTNRTYRQIEQMVQATRSGKQNIAEGSMASGTSKKIEIKLVGVARASLEELLLDYEDFLRGKGIKKWEKDDDMARKVRAMSYWSNRTYTTYKEFMDKPEILANVLICLIHQTNYLLDQQKRALEKEFLEKGGFTERLYWKRKERRKF